MKIIRKRKINKCKRGTFYTVYITNKSITTLHTYIRGNTTNN